MIFLIFEWIYYMQIYNYLHCIIIILLNKKKRQGYTLPSSKLKKKVNELPILSKALKFHLQHRQYRYP